MTLDIYKNIALIFNFNLFCFNIYKIYTKWLIVNKVQIFRSL